jgi:hypothetical protein
MAGFSTIHANIQNFLQTISLFCPFLQNFIFLRYSPPVFCQKLDGEQPTIELNGSPSITWHRSVSPMAQVGGMDGAGL